MRSRYSAGANSSIAGRRLEDVPVGVDVAQSVIGRRHACTFLWSSIPETLLSPADTAAAFETGFGVRSHSEKGRPAPNVRRSNRSAMRA